jgi:outer membrane protein assembly factor BamB
MRRVRVLLVGGLVYTADVQDGPPSVVTLQARDVATGVERWSSRLENIGSSSFIGVGNGLAYVRLAPSTDPSASNVVLAYDASTGKLAWLSRVPGGQVVQALVDGDRLFVATSATGGDVITAFDSAGHILWFASPQAVITGMTADPGRAVYVVTLVIHHADGSGTTGLAGFAESTGFGVPTPSADFGLFGLVRNTPLAFVDGFLIGTEDTRGPTAVAVDVRTGALVWSQPGATVGVASSGVVVTKANGITARDTRTGAPRWTVNLGASVDGRQNPVLAGNVVFVAIGGVLQGFDVTNGAPSGTIAVGRVVVAGGTTLDAVTPVGS